MSSLLMIFLITSEYAVHFVTVIRGVLVPVESRLKHQPVCLHVTLELQTEFSQNITLQNCSKPVDSSRFLSFYLKFFAN